MLLAFQRCQFEVGCYRAHGEPAAVQPGAKPVLGRWAVQPGRPD